MKWLITICIFLFLSCSYKQVKTPSQLALAIKKSKEYSRASTSISITKSPGNDSAAYKTDTLFVKNIGNNTYKLFYANSAINHVFVAGIFDSLLVGQQASLVIHFLPEKLKSKNGLNQFNFLLVGNTANAICSIKI